MTTAREVQFYARKVGTQVDVPVTRMNYTSTPPVIWCPICDTSQQVGHSAVCSNCKAMWVRADLVNATQRVSAASVALGGREVDVPAAPEPPPPPEVPDKEEVGLSMWSLEQLADGAEKARAASDVDMVLEIRDELESRQADVANHVATTPEPTESNRDEDDAREGTPSEELSQVEPSGERPAWMDVACPFCASMPGDKCTINGDRPAPGPHAPRIEAARE